MKNYYATTPSIIIFIHTSWLVYERIIRGCRAAHCNVTW